MKKNFLFFFGDSFLAHEAAKKAFTEAQKDRMSPFSVEVIEGTIQNLSELEHLATRIQESLATPSLFQEKKLLWVKNLNLFGDNPSSKAEGAIPFLERIQKALSGISLDSQDVLLSAKSVDKRSQSFKWFSTHGEAKEFSLDTENNSLEHWAKAAFKAQNTRIEPKALELLLSKIPSNKALLSQEIDKLSTAALNQDQQVDLALVQNLASTAEEEDFFETVEAFFTLDMQKTLDAAQHYFVLHKEPRALISALQNRGRLLLQLRVLIDSKLITVESYGISKGTIDHLKANYQKYFHTYETKSSFNVFTQNPWYLGKLLPLLRNLSLKQLFQFQEAFILYFKQSLQAPHEALPLFEQMVIRCLKRIN